MLDVSQPANPVRVGSCPGAANCFEFANDYCVVGGYGSGLQVVEVRNATNLVTVGGCEFLSGFGCGVKVAGHYAYLADAEAGLRVFDVSPGLAPVTLSHPAGLESLVLDGRLVTLQRTNNTIKRPFK